MVGICCTKSLNQLNSETLCMFVFSIVCARLCTGTSSRKSNNVHCSCNLSKAINVNMGSCTCNKLAAGPGCKTLLQPETSEIRPQQPTAFLRSLKNISGPGKNNWGNSKSQSRGLSSDVIIGRLSFARVNLFPLSN